jgi:ubiquinone/menaquinone biosynthesis C-methylase UbiE
MNYYWLFLSKILRLAFTLLYQPFAWTYDWVAATVSLGRWKDWVFTVLDDLSGPLVLELGHGPGHLLLAMREKSIQACGLDSSRQMSSLALIRQRKAGFFPLNVNGYAQYMPFSTRTFDQVVATFPSEFIWDPTTLAEIHRVLKPTGSLIVLPVAWISGRSLPDTAAKVLFRLTGQAPAPDNPSFFQTLTGRLHEAGFAVQTERKTLPSSVVLHIKATKLHNNT